MICAGNATSTEKRADPKGKHILPQSGPERSAFAPEKTPSRVIRSASSFIGALAVGIVVNQNAVWADKTDKMTTLAKSMPAPVIVSVMN